MGFRKFSQASGNSQFALPVEPVEFGLAQQEDAAEHQFPHAFGVLLSIGERQRRAPGAAEDLPTIDADLAAQLLHVVDEMPGRILVQAGVRRRASAAALVEQDDAVARRVVIAAHGRIAATAGSAMHDEHGFAVALAALLVIEIMAARNSQPAVAVGLDRGIKAEAVAR